MTRLARGVAFALVSALVVGSTGCGKEHGPAPQKASSVGSGGAGAGVGASEKPVDPSTFPPSARELWKALETKPSAELVAPSTATESSRYLDVRDIGFGAFTHRWSVAEGEKGSCELRVLVHRGETTAARVECRDDSSAARERPRVSEHWTHAARLARLREEAAKVLGARPEVSIPESLVDDVRTLEAPLSILTFGGGCGDDGQPTEGSLATKRIVAEGRLDILRLVARGLSPEGRLFAADALLRAKASKPPADDRELVEKVRLLPGLVWTCAGCIRSRSSACEALAPSMPRDAAPCPPKPPAAVPDAAAK